MDLWEVLKGKVKTGEPLPSWDDLAKQHKTTSAARTLAETRWGKDSIAVTAAARLEQPQPQVSTSGPGILGDLARPVEPGGLTYQTDEIPTPIPNLPTLQPVTAEEVPSTGERALRNVGIGAANLIPGTINFFTNIVKNPMATTKGLAEQAKAFGKYGLWKMANDVNPVLGAALASKGISPDDFEAMFIADPVAMSTAVLGMAAGIGIKGAKSSPQVRGSFTDRAPAVELPPEDLRAVVAARGYPKNSLLPDMSDPAVAAAQRAKLRESLAKAKGQLPSEPLAAKAQRALGVGTKSGQRGGVQLEPTQPDPAMGPTPTPTWSNTALALERLPKDFRSESLIPWLEKEAQKAGVPFTKTERQALQLDEFVQQNKGKKITKGEVREWIADRVVRVEERVLGGGGLENNARQMARDNGDVFENLDAGARSVYLDQARNMAETTPTKFDRPDLQLPGGENYREERGCCRSCRYL